MTSAGITAPGLSGAFRRLDIGSYTDTVVRIPDGWRFTRRETRFDA